jgi:hypothetical protein
MSILYREPSIDASYQVSIHLTKRFRGEDFLEINQSETRIICGGHACKQIVTKWAIFIEDLPRMVPTKFRFIWPSSFREEFFFRNQPIRNKNCLWWPCLYTDRDEMSNLYRGPAIDASYQVSVHLAEVFQRRRLKCEKLTTDAGCQVMAKAHIAFGKVS